jgi:hypothetical protein
VLVLALLAVLALPAAFRFATTPAGPTPPSPGSPIA